MLSVHVRDVEFASANDLEIWDYARQNGYTFVTKDADFNSLSQVHGFPPHVIWIKLGNCSTMDVMKVLKFHASTIDQIIKSGDVGIIELD